jgi:hypothetical protein
MRRYLHVILGVDGLSIGTAAPPGHPGAVASLHDGIKRGGEATSRLTPAQDVVAMEHAGDLGG